MGKPRQYSRRSIEMFKDKVFHLRRDGGVDDRRWGRLRRLGAGYPKPYKEMDRWEAGTQSEGLCGGRLRRSGRDFAIQNKGSMIAMLGVMLMALMLITTMLVGVMAAAASPVKAS